MFRDMSGDTWNRFLIRTSPYPVTVFGPNLGLYPGLGLVVSSLVGTLARWPVVGFESL
jgi:hypothetical protein